MKTLTAIIKRFSPFFVCLLLLRGGSAYALSMSVGVDGINANNLGLTGSGISIGQVELGRPGKPGFDNAANSNFAVKPAGVFVRDGAATANSDTNGHAQQVAGVMISSDNTNKGVAPGAALYSSAYVTEGINPGYQHALLSMQKVALQNNDDVRSINLSWGKSLGTSPLDGSALLSQGLDWSALQHDTLYVTAADEHGPISPATPQDSYNRINVGYTQPVGGVYRQVSAGNIFLTTPNGRRLNDIVAPGASITMPGLGGGFSDRSGTSFAAPHVTGTVALLQEYADKQIAANKPDWGTNALHHQVMKAVLMNSADKVKDTGDGRLLGMEKTILDTNVDTNNPNGKNWLQSDAATSKWIPLDDQMGTGQLNASRALTQFKGGEWDSINSAEVPMIGWDWGLTTGAGDMNKYILDMPLIGGSYISITLAWDREIQLNDTVTSNGQYDIGESFTNLGLTDMDLYLFRKGATDLSENIWASHSLVDSIEHIFFQIPETGEYEFWVHQFDEPLDSQFYSVAWWAKPVPEPSSIILLLLGTGILYLRFRHKKTC